MRPKGEEKSGKEKERLEKEKKPGKKVGSERKTKPEEKASLSFSFKLL